MDCSLGPAKRYIKASSDIHLKFFIVLSDFFSRKTLFLWLQAHRITPTVQLPRSLFLCSQMSWIRGLDYAKKLIIGFLWWYYNNFWWYTLFMAKCENGHFSWAFGPFQNHWIGKRHFYWDLKNAGIIKLGSKSFLPLNNFSLGPKRNISHWHYRW